VLIVLASVLIGARVVAAADDSVPVYAAAGTLASGHPIGPGDVRVVRVRLGAGVAGVLVRTDPVVPGPGGHPSVR
jgi:flagella basal body P-ring formation protein FlgA